MRQGIKVVLGLTLPSLIVVVVYSLSLSSPVPIEVPVESPSPSLSVVPEPNFDVDRFLETQLYPPGYEEYCQSLSDYIDRVYNPVAIDEYDSLCLGN